MEIFPVAYHLDYNFEYFISIELCRDDKKLVYSDNE